MKIFSIIKNFFSKLFKETIQAQLDIIIPIAKNAVETVAADPSILTSDEKRSRAVNMILTELGAQQLKFAKRLVNLAVEIAVVELKGLD